MDNRKFYSALKNNKKFMQEFAKKYPAFYNHPLLDESEGETFLRTLRQEYKLHPEVKDPMPDISLNIIEDNSIAPEQNFIIYRLLTDMPFMMHSTEYFELKYVMRGSAAIYMNDSRFELSEGNLTLIPPNVKNCFCFFEESVVFNIIIRASTLSSAFFNLINHDDFLAAFFSNALYGTNTNYIIWNFARHETIERIILSCEKEFYSDRPYNERLAEIYLMQLFIEILRIEKEEDFLPAIPKIPSKEVIHVLTQYLYARSFHVSLRQAAAICNYSQRQLERIIYDESGVSFSQFKAELRLGKACAMLKNPHIKIKEIASSLGFESSAYFTKLFHKQYHMTPKEYRSFYTKNGGNIG